MIATVGDRHRHRADLERKQSGIIGGELEFRLDQIKIRFPLAGNVRLAFDHLQTRTEARELLMDPRQELKRVLQCYGPDQESIEPLSLHTPADRCRRLRGSFGLFLGRGNTETGEATQPQAR